MFYPNIEAERARVGKTRQELSELLGVTPKTLRNWQCGKTKIPTSAIVKMASIFNCSTDYLLGLEGQKTA